MKKHADLLRKFLNCTRKKSCSTHNIGGSRYSVKEKYFACVIRQFFGILQWTFAIEVNPAFVNMLGYREASASALLEKIIAAVNWHAANTSQHDDMTIVLLKRKEA